MSLWALQDIEATDASIDRANKSLDKLKEQANIETAQIAEEVAHLEEAAKDLDVCLSGGTEHGVLLCLNDVEEFKAIDKELTTTLTSYWEAQISDSSSSSEFAEVSAKLYLAPYIMPTGD